MNPEPFRFKQFHVYHHLCAHKVGTDGVLLGVWAEHPNPTRILDVGSGSGLINFMLAQRYPQATFVGIEQHAASLHQARQSLAEGPFSDRGEFIQADFLLWETEEKFDLIVSNPPFFEKAQKTNKQERDAARRQFSLPHEAMLQKIATLLKPEGTIALVLPIQEGVLLTEQVKSIPLYLNRLCEVRSFSNTKTIRHLLEFQTKHHPLNKSEIIIRNEDGTWHESYQRLTDGFYL